VDTSELEETANSYQEQVSVAVAQDSDLSSYVQMLEERFDSQVEGGERNLPTGDDLARNSKGFSASVTTRSRLRKLQKTRTSSLGPL
jgi:hypothetical protein